MYKKIALQLDKIASSLEEKGLTKEAEQLDVVANTLEKVAYSLKFLQLFKNDLPNLAQSIESMVGFIENGNDAKVKYTTGNSLAGVDKLIEHFENLKKHTFGGQPDKDIDGILKGLELVKKDIETKHIEKLKSIGPRLEKFESLWKGIERKVHDKQML